MTRLVRYVPDNADNADVQEIERRLTAHSYSLEAVYEQCLAAENVPLALAASRRLENTYRLLAELRGQLRPIHLQVNAASNVDAIKATLVAVLKDYPEAQVAAAQALLGEGGGDD